MDEGESDCSPGRVITLRAETGYRTPFILLLSSLSLPRSLSFIAASSEAAPDGICLLSVFLSQSSQTHSEGRKLSFTFSSASVALLLPTFSPHRHKKTHKHTCA